MIDRASRPASSTTALLIAAPIAVSTAPIFIKYCAMPPGVIAGGRLLCAALVFLPFALGNARAEIGSLTGKEKWALLGAGVAFGLHFVLFNTALELTGFESVVFLLTVQPLMAAFLGRAFLGERTTGWMWTAALIAMGGAGLMMAEDLAKDDVVVNGTYILGDIAVLLCALAFVVTHTFGRRLRVKLSSSVYTSSMFLVGGLVSLAWAAALGQSPVTGDAESWYWLAVLIFVPTIMGHSMFNYLVKHVRVFFIQLVLLVEPIVGVIGKWIVDDPARFGPNNPGTSQIIGAVVLIAGVTIGLVANERARRRGDV